MKKILLIILFAAIFGSASYYEHNYTRENCKVTQICDGIVTFEDRCGFTWDCETDGFEVGDYANLKLFDKGSTAYIGDDIVKKVMKI